MLMFGMDTASLTARDTARLNNTYHTLLRRVHRAKATYFTEVPDPSQHTVRNRGMGPTAHFLTTLTQRRVTLAFRLLSLPPHVLQRECCLTAACTFRELRGPTRIGRPRTKWLSEVFKAAYKGLFPARDYRYPGALLDIRNLGKERGPWSTLALWTENVHSHGLFRQIQ